MACLFSAVPNTVIQKVQDELLLLARQLFDLLEAELQLRDRSWAGAHWLRFTTQQLGHGDLESFSQLLNQIEGGVLGAAFVVVDGFAGGIELCGQFSLREALPRRKAASR